MPQLDFATFAPQLVWLLITFVALYIIMAKIAIPRISDVLEARQKKIDDNLERAQELRKEAEAAMAAYETALAEARSKAHEEIAKVTNDLAAKSAAEEAKLAEELNKKIADGEAAIQTATDDALKSIDAMAAEVAASAFERLTGDAADDAAVKKAVQAELKA